MNQLDSLVCVGYTASPSFVEDFVKKLLTIGLFLACACSSFAQLTQQQKVTDFKALVGLYDKNYGPYEWKVKTFGYDLLKIQPWLDRVNASPDDLSFYDICIRYVAGLQDSHDEFTLPSIYEAYLPLTADIYDGHVLIDFVDTTVLDPTSYPFTVGDELLSVDGKSVVRWVSDLAPYAVNGEANPVSRNRLAVATMLDRYQSWYTYASRIQPGDTATLVIRSQSGKIGSYTVAWQTVGLPLHYEGPVPNPTPSAANRSAFAASAVKRPMKELAKVANNSWGLYTGPRAPRRTPAISSALKKMRRHQSSGHLHPAHTLAGGLDPFESFFPLFNVPPGFKLRLGAGATDEFVTGTFPVGKKTMGFIRIPSFEPTDETNALLQMQQEVTYFQQNTSGLVVDLMSNGGGDICYSNYLIQYLSPKPFRSTPFALRATEEWVIDYEELLLEQELGGAPQSDINLTAQYLTEIRQALAQNRGLSVPIPIGGPDSCNGGGGVASPPATDSNGKNIAYTKPILLLINNFTLSAAELFSATMQDIGRATTYGVRTDGGGGDVIEFDYNTGPYAEGSARDTESIAVRTHNIFTPGLPSAPYIENIGVQGDVLADYQTRANLLSGGVPFVNGFSLSILNLVKTGHP
jgi:hypothetical protein